MPYVFLAAAILLECGGTFMLKLSEGFTQIAPSIASLVLYGLCFAALSKALEGVALNVAYATWSGVGIILATAISYFVFKETLNLPIVIGTALIIAGVVLANYFSSAA